MWQGGHWRLLRVRVWENMGILRESLGAAVTCVLLVLVFFPVRPGFCANILPFAPVRLSFQDMEHEEK